MVDLIPRSFYYILGSYVNCSVTPALKTEMIPVFFRKQTGKSGILSFKFCCLTTSWVLVSQI